MFAADGVVTDAVDVLAAADVAVGIPAVEDAVTATIIEAALLLLLTFCSDLFLLPLLLLPWFLCLVVVVVVAMVLASSGALLSSFLFWLCGQNAQTWHLGWLPSTITCSSSSFDREIRSGILSSWSGFTWIKPPVWSQSGSSTTTFNHYPQRLHMPRPSQDPILLGYLIL